MWIHVKNDMLDQAGWAKIPKKVLIERIFLNEVPKNPTDNNWTEQVKARLQVLDRLNLSKCTQAKKLQVAQEHPETMMRLLENAVIKHIPDTEVCAWLRELSSFINEEPTRGQQLLMIAVQSGNPPIVKQLLDIGISPNEMYEIPGETQDTKSQAPPRIYQGTALFLAVLARNPEMVSLLLKNGADVDRINDNGESVIDMINSTLLNENSHWGSKTSPRTTPTDMEIYRLLEAHANGRSQEALRNQRLRIITSQKDHNWPELNRMVDEGWCLHRIFFIIVYKKDNIVLPNR